jgi:hypothetical protein
MPKAVYHYQDFGEVITPREAGLLTGTTRQTFATWIKAGECPFGELIQGVHYYKAGPEVRIIKSRLCELFGIRGGENNVN